MVEKKVSDLAFIIVISLILNLILFPLYINDPDVTVLLEYCDFLSSGKMPYRDFEGFFFTEHPYPPVTYYDIYLIFTLGLNNYIGLKIHHLVYQLFAVFFFYKIVETLFNNRKYSFLLTLIYATCPYNFLFNGLMGTFLSIVLFFMLGSLYFFLKENYIVSFLFLSVGFMHQLIPLFLIFPYLLYLVGVKKLKKIIIFVIVFFISIMLLSLPYLILIPDIYLEYFVGFFTKSNYTFSFKEIYPPIFNTVVLPLNIFNFEINITFYTIYELVIILSFLALFSLVLKVDTENKLIGCILGFLLLVPLITRSFHFKIFYILVPFLTLFPVLVKDINLPSKKVLRRNVLILFFIFILLEIGTIVFYYNTEYVSEGLFGTIDFFYFTLLIYITIWSILLSVNKFTRKYYWFIIWMIFSSSYFLFYALYHLTGIYFQRNPYYFFLYIILMSFLVYEILRIFLKPKNKTEFSRN